MHEEVKMNASEKDKQLLNDILNQPNAWADTIGVVEAKASRLTGLFQGIDEVVFTGCGSGLNAGTTIAAAFQYFTGVRARAVQAAEIIFFSETVFVENSSYVVVSISRSGSTTETVTAQSEAQKRGIPTLAITCHPQSPLAREATETLILEAANEVSVPSTQSQTSSVLAGQVMTAVLSRNAEYLQHLRRLPQAGRAVIERYHDLGREIAADARIEKFAFLGSGPLFGLARDCQLKTKEIAGMLSDAYPQLEFRHGPTSTVDEHTLVIVLSSDRMRQAETSFLAEIKGMRGNTFLLCDEADEQVRPYADYVAEFRSGLPDFARDILYMPTIHFLAYYKALNDGRSPASPRNLSYWVEVDTL